MSEPIPTYSSGLLTASGPVKVGPVRITDCEIITDGVNAVNVTLFDNATSPGGKILFKGEVPGAGLFGGASWNRPVQADYGIYLSISGIGGACIIYTI